MTARALRVGVVLGGCLVEERLFADAHPITIGQSLRSRLSIPADGVPFEHALFVRDHGRLLLNPTPQMDARLAAGGAIQTTLQGPTPIERGARGKVQIGTATILFQEVATPVRTPRPQLPASVRGTLGDRIDRRLAAIVGASLALHVGIATWAWLTDIEEAPRSQASAAAMYRQDTITITMPDPDPVVGPSQPGAATPVAPVQTPAPIVSRPRVAARAPSATPKLPTVDDAARFAQMLTGNDERAGGRTEMGPRIPGSELDQQIRDIRDNDRRIGNEDGGFRTGPRDGIQDNERQLVRDAPSQLDQQAQREERTPPGGRITLRPAPQPLTLRSASEIVIATIQNRYMHGLKRCYTRALAGEPSLSGKVKLSFTVTETGKTADAEARGLTTEVDACIEGQMVGWRFPIPKDADGDAIDLDVALTLALVPST